MSEKWSTIQCDVSEHERPIVEASMRLILRTLRDPRVTAKHPPWDWTKESCDQHLMAATGHANLAARQGYGFKPMDGEDHVARALTRCAEAAACRHITNREPPAPPPSSIAEAV
jgi:hypothetical protein